MSLSPISFSNPRVSFRGETENKADIFGAPGKFAATEEGDKVDITKDNLVADEPKKGGALKTIGKVLGGVVVLLGASFGLYKWKGDKWLLPEAKGFMAGIKKALVKPGEFIDQKLISKLSGKGAKAAAESTEAAAETAAETGAAAAEVASEVAEGGC